MDEASLEEILGAFATAQKRPSTKTFGALSEAAGLAKSSVERLYGELTKKITGEDDDANGPMPGLMG